MIATIESIDFTSWLFRLIGTKKHKHKSATRMGKWAVTFVVLAAALLTLPLYGQQTASGDSAGTDVPVNQVAGVTNPTTAALDSGAVAAPSSSQGGE
jgi:negative regulator of sigma E activity